MLAIMVNEALKRRRIPEDIEIVDVLSGHSNFNGCRYGAVTWLG
jgi:hypothetical protein